MDEVLAIGIDIGGTQLRAGVVDKTGRRLVFFHSNSFSKEAPEHLFEAIVQAVSDERIRAASAQGEIVGVGIGMAGLVDASTGLVYASPHFPRLCRYPLKDLLEKRLPFPVVIDNDANCLATGEVWQGVAREWPDFILVAIGTGIGGGFVRGGRIDRGTTGFAGEIGHFCIDQKGSLCACGKRGCWETFASGSGLHNIIRDSERYKPFARFEAGRLGPELFSLALSGNELALSVYEELGKNIAIGLAALVNVTGIHRFVLAGGLYEARDYFMPALFSEFPKRTYIAPYLPSLDLRWSTLAPWGGVYGAAHTAFRLNL